LDTFMIFVGIFMSLLMIPHIYRMWQEKSSSGQSLLSLSGYLICFVLWIIYGIEKQNTPLIICNTLSTLLGVAYWITIVYYRYCYGRGGRCVPTALECWCERCIEFAKAHSRLRK
jgi:MtN3 and saliva related transmembrane protein